MQTTHEASLYRRNTSTGRTASGRPKHSWGTALATGLPGLLQPTSGRLVSDGEGRQVKIDALYLVHPSRYPAGVAPLPADVLVITAGPRTRSTFRVHDVVGMAGGPWDDELQLVAIEETVPEPPAPEPEPDPEPAP